MIFLYNYFDYLVILSNPMFSTQLMDSSPNFTKHHKLEKEHKMYSRELMGVYSYEALEKMFIFFTKQE